MKKIKAQRSSTKKLKTSQQTSNIAEFIPPLGLEQQNIAISPYHSKKARQKLISLIVFALLFAVVVGTITGLVVNPKIGIIIGIGLPVCVLSYIYPRAALWMFLIYMPFGGTVVYWLGEGNSLVQLIKDVFYIPALIGLIRECQRKRLPIFISKPLIVTLGIIFTLCLIVLFFTNGVEQFSADCSSFSSAILYDANGNIVLNSLGKPVRRICREGIPLLQGLIGLKVLLGYVPLIFCAYYLIDTRKKLIWFFRIFLMLAIICTTLGLAQYYLLKTGHCVGTRLETGAQLYKATQSAKCLVGGSLLYSPEYGQIRLPGTFVSPWHWTWFLVANAMICFTPAFSETSVFWRTASLIGLGLIEINALICGQRLAFVLVPAVIVLQLILTGQIANLKKFLPIGIAFALILSIGLSFINPEFIQERTDSFVSRWNQASPLSFIIDQFNTVGGDFSRPLGDGLGKGSNASRSFGSVTFIETFHPKLLFEIGYVGLIAFMVFITHLVILTFKAFRSLRDPYLRNIGSSLWVFILIIGYFPYWYPLDTDPVGVYFWLFAGLIFRLQVLDRSNKVNKGIEESLLGARKFLKTPAKSKLSPSI
jgi:hypothetical protein